MGGITTTPDVVQEDLDINTMDGLRAFLQYTEDAYVEILESAKVHLGEDIHQKLEQATAIYEALKMQFDDAFLVKEKNEHIKEELANDLQEKYNELLAILDSIERVEEGESFPQETTPSFEESEGEEGAGAHIEPIKVQAFPQILTVTSLGGATPERAVPEPMPEVQSKEMAESTSDTGVSSEEPLGSAFEDISNTEKETSSKTSENLVEAGVLVTLKEKADELVFRAETLLEKYEEITGVVSSDAVLNIGQHYYKQLGITAERARGVLRNLAQQGSKSGKVTELIAEHIEDALEEITNNLDQLDRGLGGFFEVEENAISAEIASKSQTGAVALAKEDEEEKAIPILVTQKVEPVALQKETPAIHNQTMKPSQPRAEKMLSGEWGVLMKKVLAIPRYKNFVAQNFTSPVQFEAMLRREIQRIEMPSKFDSVLGFNYNSPFNGLLRDMSIKEVVEFDSQPRDVIKAHLAEVDIKYEVYLDWIDSLDTMLNLTNAHPTVTFGELFIRTELETLLQHDEGVVAA
jgi:hypothetical protein